MQSLRALVLLVFLFFTRVAALPTEHLEARQGMTYQQVIVNIQSVTTISQSTTNTISGLATGMSVSQIAVIGKDMVTDFTTIVNALKSFLVPMQQTAPFGASEADAVVAVLSTFVQIHQQLLSTVIGQHGFFAYCGFTAPVAAVLRILETTIDNFAFAMINLIPTQTSMVMSGQVTLDASCSQAIATYNQICLPFIPPAGICVPFGLAAGNSTGVPA